MQVYLDPCTVNSRKVLAGLDLIGSDYELKLVNYFTGEHKSPEYTKINPHATVPAAVHNALTLTESNAILQYAADLTDSPVYPKDLARRANVNRWLLWEASAWFPSCYIYLVEYVVKPLLGQQPDQAVIDAQAPRWNQLAGILDGELAKSRYIAGDELTIADIAIAAPMHLHAAQRLPLEHYPNLKRWMTQDIESLPSWKKTQDAVDKALLPGTPASGVAVSAPAAVAVASNSTNYTNGTNGTNGMNGTNGVAKDVKASFNYTKDVEALTELYFYESDAADKVHAPGDDAHEMPVKDGWKRVDEFSIDKQGFALRGFKSAYDGWEDDEQVKQKFYPDVVGFLKKETGAKRVLVFDHTIRTKGNSAKKLTQETNTSQRAPVTLVHCDYTAESGPVRVRQLLEAEADDLLSRRVAFINVWKPIHNVVEEFPLAMCDVTSSPPEDFFKLYLRYRDRTGENYVMRHSPNHQWWYFPKITPEQVILLKTYDSETDGRARFVGHSAFEDPTSAPDAPARESVEIRTICFF